MVLKKTPQNKTKTKTQKCLNKHFPKHPVDSIIVFGGLILILISTLLYSTLLYSALLYSAVSFTPFIQVSCLTVLGKREVW